MQKRQKMRVYMFTSKYAVPFALFINAPTVKHIYLVNTGKQNMYTCEHVTM